MYSTPKLKKAFKELITDVYKKGQLAVIDDRLAPRNDQKSRDTQANPMYGNMRKTQSTISPRAHQNQTTRAADGGGNTTTTRHCEPVANYPNQFHLNVPEKVADFDPTKLTQPSVDAPPPPSSSPFAVTQ